MSEQHPTPEEDTSVLDDTPTGTVTPEQQEVDWAKRYADLQPEYTRTAQEASELRQRDALYQTMLTAEDPQARREAADALGFEYPDDEPDEYVDPTDHLAKKVEALEAQLSQRSQAELQQQQLAQLEQVAEQKLEALKVPEHVRDWVVSRAVSLPADDLATAIEQAWTEFAGVRDAEQKAWRQTKQAPHVSASGQQGAHAPNLDDDQQRQAWMAAQLADMDAAS